MHVQQGNNKRRLDPGFTYFEIGQIHSVCINTGEHIEIVFGDHANLLRLSHDFEQSVLAAVQDDLGGLGQVD